MAAAVAITRDLDAGTVRIVCNPAAGTGGRGGTTRLARELADAGVHAVLDLVEPTDLAEHVGRLEGAPMIAVAGGDGSMGTAAAALLGSDTALVPIPTGRLNHFARRLGVDSVPAGAAALASGRERRVAVGRADGAVFLNTAVIGAYADFVRLRERLRPLLTNWPAAACAAALVLGRRPSLAVTVRTPDRELRCRTTFLWVGVGRDSFPAPHEAPPAGPGDTLEVVLLEGGRRAALGLAWRVFRSRFGEGRAPSHRSADVFHTPWIEVGASRPVPITLDGETRWMTPPVRLRLEPGALRVRTPAD